MGVNKRAGARVACALIPVMVTDLGTYPGYGGTAITGMVEVTLSGTEATLKYDLMGVEDECTTPGSAANSCGIHIHAGTSCAKAPGVGGHFYGGSVNSDPWTTVVYTASGTDGKASGSVTADLGVPFAPGHALVIHNR